MFSIRAKILGACVVDGIVLISLRFCLGQALLDFGETGLVIVVWLPGLDLLHWPWQRSVILCVWQ